MTASDLPLTGGSYIRHPDGRLELVEGSLTLDAPIEGPPEPEPVDPKARKGAIKAPLKE